MCCPGVVDGPVVVAVDGAGREWLQAADVILGTHRSRRRAARWLRRTRARYPGCVVTVAGHTGGRWCLVGLPDRTVIVCGRDLAQVLPVVGTAAVVAWFGGWHDGARRPPNTVGMAGG